LDTFTVWCVVFVYPLNQGFGAGAGSRAAPKTLDTL